MPLTETEASGTPEARTTTRTWDSRFPLKTSETRGGITREWRYDDQGHVTKEMVHPSSQVLVNDSCPTSAPMPWLFTCHEIRYAYSYDPNNHVVLQVVKTGPTPENGTTVTDYHSNGDLWKTTNALGQVEEILSVNAHGQVTDRVDPNGRHTVTTYNALRQPINVSVGDDITQYSYAANGRLQSITRPDGTTLNYTRTPAGSVKTVSRTTGTTTEQIEYKRDSRGNILETVASKTGETPQRWLNSYDEAGRLIRSSDGTDSWHTDYTYNANNLETRACRSGEICDLTGYTALDQIQSQAMAPLLSNGALGPQTALFDLWYDQAGRVSQVADPNGIHTQLNYNEIDKTTQEMSPDFGTRNALFDRAGNERMRVDADDNATEKTYDSLDRLREVYYADRGRLSLSWDTPTLNNEAAANYVGRLARRSRLNAHGEGAMTVTDDLRYNSRGDVIEAVQAVTNQPTLNVATAYSANADGNGKPTRIDYPGGFSVHYTYGGDGRPLALTGTLGSSNLTLATDIQWQPLINRLSKLNFGNGLTYERKRDAGGRLSAISLSNAAQTLYSFNLGYDSRNRVASYGEIGFGYDDRDHLAEQRQGNTQQRTLLQHDFNGNLQQTQRFNAAGALVASNTLNYDGNRLLQENQTPAPAAGGLDGSQQPYQYDQSGYITAHGETLFGYDTARNMVHYLGSDYSRYVYDGNRRRVFKIGPGSIRQRYAYDNQDHLLYEQSANGARRNYVWLGDIPLAVVDQKSDGSLAAVYFIETDFTNTPRYLRRASGNLSQPVWHWPIAPYGNTPAQEDPDGDGSKVTFNLRYPGQYYDAESGLHYNHTRFFSPRTGRYLQPDLLKLEGGINVYTYANGNPVHYTDPTGTSWTLASTIFNAVKSFLGFAQKVEKAEKAVNAVQKGAQIAKSWSVPQKVIDKIPSSWKSSANKKGVGERWQDPNNKGNGVRIDQGNPNHTNPTQQVDHVVVRSNGQVIGRDGVPIEGSIAESYEQAHIPLSEYGNWTSWNSPR
ncbi:RHS repeat-associated core domain-containing protein [Methylomonas koyamae]|uniref:RHS repeat-associated core domain-containing protein n=1 Tax=Methylomonas koyamae TaxID=702114 RepID=UPI002873E68D|nr:RHS repeat-associated core domain-containing protein [Methylomonas koyamae]WNB76611.1 RHS repeat-associated core domain-containing protein [Methylomonas koyamae]